MQKKYRFNTSKTKRSQIVLLVVVDRAVGRLDFFVFVFFAVFHFLVFAQRFSSKVHHAGLQVVDLRGLLFSLSYRDSL